MDEILMLMDFYEDSEVLEKENPNDVEFGQLMRVLISNYRKKIND